MKVLIGIIFIVALSLLAAFIIYFFLVRPKRKKKTRRRVGPKAKPKKALAKKKSQMPSGSAQKPKKYRYELPPGIPRDINTIKIIAKEDPQVIIDIVRKWMKER
tara:strand:- start:911 stop:1222 length:312 start_codon:yes stop_codon:yes gene_type:complete